MATPLFISRAAVGIWRSRCSCSTEAALRLMRRIVLARPLFAARAATGIWSSRRSCLTEAALRLMRSQRNRDCVLASYGSTPAGLPLWHSRCLPYWGQASIILQSTAIDEEDGDGNTPLHLACGEGHVEFATLLLDRGMWRSRRSCLTEAVALSLSKSAWRALLAAPGARKESSTFCRREVTLRARNDAGSQHTHLLPLPPLACHFALPSPPVSPTLHPLFSLMPVKNIFSILLV